MELYFPFWNFFGVFCPVGTLRAKSPKVPLLQHLWVTLGRSKKSFRQCIGSKLEGSSRTQCQIPKWYCIFHLLEILSFFPMKSLTNSLSHCNYFWWYKIQHSARIYEGGVAAHLDKLSCCPKLTFSIQLINLNIIVSIQLFSSVVTLIMVQLCQVMLSWRGSITFGSRHH